MTISADGWRQFSIWEHSQTVRDLYRRRCRREAEEMTCAAQAAELLAAYARAHDTVLDVGCGSGYFFHSLQARRIPVDYYGIDASESLLEIGREELPRYGLGPDRLQAMRIEDLSGSAEHVVCMNVLSNLDNFHKPLERMLKVATRSVILRESIADEPSYSYVRDEFLDPGVDLMVYVNTYARKEVTAFIERHGFSVSEEIDRRTGGKPELVIGYPHHWTFLVAIRH